MPRQIIDPESGDKKFDALVHVRNRQGQIAEERHYECIWRNGVQIFKDKKGFYYADGSDVPLSHLVELGLMKPKAEAPKPAITAARTIPTPAPAPVQLAPAGSPDHPDQGPPNAEQEPQPEGGEDEDPNPEPPASDDQGSTGL